MSVDVVVARYCEDLGWLRALPGSWRVHVYDKSKGGPRQRYDVPGAYATPCGPDEADLWPGSTPLPNVGCEANSYLYHLARRGRMLAAVTVFLQGDPFVEATLGDLEAAVGAASVGGFGPIGRVFECDRDGRPQLPGPLPEIAEMWGLFAPRELPTRLKWVSGAQFAVSSARLMAIRPGSFAAARDACADKARACAMERIWMELLS